MDKLIGRIERCECLRRSFWKEIAKEKPSLRSIITTEVKFFKEDKRVS